MKILHYTIIAAIALFSSNLYAATIFGCPGVAVCKSSAFIPGEGYRINCQKPGGLSSNFSQTQYFREGHKIKAGYYYHLPFSVMSIYQGQASCNYRSVFYVGGERQVLQATYTTGYGQIYKPFNRGGWANQACKSQGQCMVIKASP